jgi:hypothetical protein
MGRSSASLGQMRASGSWRAQMYVPALTLPTVFFFFFFFPVLGLELKAYTLSPFLCDGCFLDRVSRTICLGWL